MVSDVSAQEMDAYGLWCWQGIDCRPSGEQEPLQRGRPVEGVLPSHMGYLMVTAPLGKTKGRGPSGTPTIESPLGPDSMKTDAQHSQDSKRKTESNLLGGEILQGRDC